MLRIVIMLLSAALALSLSAEEMGVVRGLIVDGETGEPLVGANLIVYDAGGRPAFGTTTNLDGRFSLRLPSGRHSIEISYVSYATKTVTGVEVNTDRPFQLSEALTAGSHRSPGDYGHGQARALQRSIDAGYPAEGRRGNRRHQFGADEQGVVFERRGRAQEGDWYYRGGRALRIRARPGRTLQQYTGQWRADAQPRAEPARGSHGHFSGGTP